MESKELRIENLVTYYGRVVSITGITEEHPFIYLITADYLDWDEIEPIPLTEEWLLKFGFEKTKHDFYDLKIPKGVSAKLTMNNSFNSFQVCQSGYGFNVELNYVHQLQNLYFALVGKELTIKNQE